jgi:hypothetical protein
MRSQSRRKACKAEYAGSSLPCSRIAARGAQSQFPIAASAARLAKHYDRRQSPNGPPLWSAPSGASSIRCRPGQAQLPSAAPWPRKRRDDINEGYIWAREANHPDIHGQGCVLENAAKDFRMAAIELLTSDIEVAKHAGEGSVRLISRAVGIGVATSPRRSSRRSTHGFRPLL